MKNFKVAAELLLIMFTLTITASAEYFVPEVEHDYRFAGSTYKASEIDTDGNIFAGVISQKLAVSSDFEVWDVKRDLGNVSAVFYLKGLFCAVGDGCTYTSADGENWSLQENNLPAAPEGGKSAKLNGSVISFAGGKTYQTYDALEWREVTDVPNGVTPYIMDNKFFLESSEYMRGFYYSENGESFKKLNIDGYDESHGHFTMSFHDGEYHINDYWRDIDDEEFCYHYSSTDLINWKTDIVPRDVALSPEGCNFIEINGTLHAFDINGNDLVYNGEKWVSGEYQMNETYSSFPPFVCYRLTESGLLAWTNAHNSYYLANNGELKACRSIEERNPSLFEKDGEVYVYLNDDTLSVQSYKYDNGTWVKSDCVPDSWYADRKADNGEISLTTRYIERGSYRYREDNEVIDGIITYRDGSTAKVKYEGAKDDAVEIAGGSGYFLMNGFGWDNNLCISKDGVNRYPLIGMQGMVGERLYSNADSIFYMSYENVINRFEKAQLNRVEIPDAIRIMLDDTYLSFITAPVVEDGRTLVSVRFLFEEMGAQVTWDEIDYACTIKLGDTSVTVKIDEKTAVVNGEEKELDVPARLINEKTMLPMRFISEQFGFDVEYDETANIAMVKSV